MNSLVSTILFEHTYVSSMKSEHKLTCNLMLQINFFFIDVICFVFWYFNNMEAVTLSICNSAKKFKVSLFVKERSTFLAILVNFKHFT
jgi:hypothetical protein